MILHYVLLFLLATCAAFAFQGNSERLPNATRIAKAKMDFDRTIKKLREDIETLTGPLFEGRR